MNYKQACLKRTIEQVLIAPLILLGKVIGMLSPLKTNSSLFLFFPSDGIGGATKVNADIISLLQSENPTIIFSKKYNNNAFANSFKLPGVNIIDLRDRIDNKKLYFINIIYRGIISAWINKMDHPIVFGGESIYLYKVIPYLKKSTRIFELSHLNTWLNYNQAFIKYLDGRLTSTEKLKRDIIDQYRKNGVPEKYYSKVSFIDNWVEIPDYRAYEPHKNLNILFVGRGSPQKRVHILSKIAERLMKEADHIKFTFVGDVKQLLSEYVQRHAEVHENINDKQVLTKIYDQADILILTSAFEGLPIVVMDMMARGKVVLSTAVDGIPDYVIHQETGLLIKELQDEERIVDEAISLIYEMDKDRAQLQKIGHRAYLFAQKHFHKDLFETKYKAIFDRTKS